jgi:hypothetical protein
VDDCYQRPIGSGFFFGFSVVEPGMAFAFGAQGR